MGVKESQFSEILSSRQMEPQVRGLASSDVTLEGLPVGAGGWHVLSRHRWDRRFIEANSRNPRSTSSVSMLTSGTHERTRSNPRGREALAGADDSESRHRP